MARRRFIPTSDYALSTTKGHSVLRQRPYSPGFHRRPVDDLYDYSYARRHLPYDTTGNENYTRSEVNRELMLSSAALDDGFDIASKSRNRDRDVMSAANRAIPSSSDLLPVSSTTADSYNTESRRLSSLRRSNPKRSASLPPAYRTPTTPSYNTTTTIVPLNLYSRDRSDKAIESKAPYLSMMNKLDTTRTLNERSYEPAATTSTRLRAGYISPRYMSPYGSPGGSGAQTPIEYDYEYSPPVSGESLSSSAYRKRHRPRVLATKRKVGNYYDRLLQRRANQSGGGRNAKYWPYINVEDIEYDDTYDLLSDTESNDGRDYYVTEPDNETDTGKYYYASNDGGDAYYETENIPEPQEYIPFRPNYNRANTDYDTEDSPYFKRLSELSVAPYMPKRDPTKTSVADDITFNAMVAASAARARRALQDVNLDDYDSASLVLSVEGEYQGPKSEVPVAFRYVSRPLALKTPASVVVSAYDSDNSFDKYITDMKRFRGDILARLEDGYKALSACAPKYTKSLAASYPGTSYTTPSSTVALPSSTSTYVSPYRRRLRESEGYKYGRSLELYPLSSRQSSTELLSSSAKEPRSESLALKLYDSSSHPDSHLSTLAKIEIKVATETYQSPRSSVIARRALRGNAQPVVFSSSKNVQKKEAALVGRKVDIVKPENRRARSKYAQDRMRKIHLEHREEISPAVTASSSLRASKPFRAPQLIKAIRDVDGFKKPNNVLSWKSLNRSRRQGDPESRYAMYRYYE